MKMRAAFGYDVDLASLASALVCEDESLTIQSQKEEADINTIVRRFGVTGQLPLVAMPPSIEEFGEIFDFRSALEVVMRARESFDALPADVRSRFENNPAGFVSFVDGELAKGELGELRKMGLAVPEAPKAVDPTPAKPA